MRAFGSPFVSGFARGDPPRSGLARAFFSSVLVVLTACEMGTGGDDGGITEAQDVEINFAAVVGAETFACGQSFADIGTSASTVSPQDFRLFVSEVALIDGAGNAVDVELENDGKWQTDRVTLLDFEDATGDCANGNVDTNTAVIGTVRAGTYAGLRFTIGIPFADNHNDVTLAPSPLNISSLFWNWNGGYKFMRIDNATTGLPGGYNVHIGSTGCDGDMSGNVTTCTNDNRVTKIFDTFDVDNDVVTFDLAALLAGVDVDTNMPDTAPGCQSAPGDDDCTAIYDAIGLGDGAGSFISRR